MRAALAVALLGLPLALSPEAAAQYKGPRPKPTAAELAEIAGVGTYSVWMAGVRNGTARIGLERRSGPTAAYVWRSEMEAQLEVLGTRARFTHQTLESYAIEPPHRLLAARILTEDEERAQGLLLRPAALGGYALTVQEDGDEDSFVSSSNGQSQSITSR